MKRLLSTLWLLLCVVAIWAAKANGEPVTITQPDGTQLTVVLHGDENVNWYTTLDGVLLVQQNRAYYIAKVSDDGTLAATTLLAHSPLQRNNLEKAAIAAQDYVAFQQQFVQKEAPVNKISVDPNPQNHYFPHTGAPKALVLLVEFSDTTFSLADPKASFEQYLNGEGRPTNLGGREDLNYKSVKQYFSDMSNGTFTPVFDVKGVYHLAHPLAYYGEGKSDHIERLIPDACQAAVNAGVDFSEYDADNDGYVDLVYVIYAGYSASISGNSTDCIWPKSGTTNGGTYNGKKVFRYGVNNELNGYPGCYASEPHKRINGLGLFVHEFSHTMGLPDLYATSGSTGDGENNQGMEYWDVMDGGEYVNNGHYPTAYTAWEREVLGWFSPDTLTDTLAVEQLAPIDYGGKAFKIFNGDTQEYVMVQNIQQAGWNSKLPGHGLLAYRVNYQRSTVNVGDRPNNTKGQPQIVVLAADGMLKAASQCSSRDEYYTEMAGDTYPGTTGCDSVSFEMTDHSILNKPLVDINESEEGYIRFDFLGKKTIVDNISTITSETDNRTSNNIYTLDGRYMGNRIENLPKGIYLYKGKKLVK